MDIDNVGSREETPHDQRVECLHWAASLNAMAGMPPSLTSGGPTESAIRFYESVAAHLQGMIEELRAGGQ